jgi:hypothetical protein
MLRILTLGLLFQSALSPSFGQQNDRRVEDALAEITLLKRVVAEQDRRIANLEKSLDTYRLGAVADSQSSGVSSRRAGAQAITSLRWKRPSAWSLIKKGMSRAQVVAILGQPTSIDTIMNDQMLVYQGAVSCSGSVTGTVKLDNDQVWQVNIPAF